MKRAKQNWLAGVLVFAFLAMTGFASAQEHPAEHPKEHPTSKKQSPLTKDELAAAIAAYVEQDAKLKGGFFLVFDGEANQTLALALDKVHKERLSRIAPDVYFACADFNAAKGKVYDLDIFMKGPDKDHLQVTQITVHKESGKERYTWYEEGGVWKMKPLSTKKEK